MARSILDSVLSVISAAATRGHGLDVGGYTGVRRLRKSAIYLREASTLRLLP